MLPLYGSRKLLCDGIPRRDLLQIGGLGALGLTTTDLFKLQAAQAEHAKRGASFGKAKACILIFPFGSPPQHETFDPKPEAPREIQGEMKSAATNVAGIDFCEHLPKTAQVADRMTVVRSMTHPYPVHGVAYALTGMPTYTPAIEANPRAQEHWPFLGSAVDFVERARAGGQVPPVPRNIGLPWRFGSKSTVPTLAGPYAAFLGAAYDPVWTDFEGRGTKVVPKLTYGQTADVRDPFAGIAPGGKFRVSDGGELPAELTVDRLGLRRSLKTQFDEARRWMQTDPQVDSFDEHRRLAWSLLATNKVRAALDPEQETAATRERYGHTLFGQSCLVARRLVEAGAKFVSVFWDPFEPFGGSCWDTHANHFPRLKDYLLPVFDDAYSALLADLDERGLLDETLVLNMSEHGRTPQIDNKPKGAGRHHWSRVYSATLAGGGTARGKVVGRSDSHGGDVADTPVSPKDLLATTLHLLGIDGEATVPDKLGRKLPIAGDGRVRHELLG